MTYIFVCFEAQGAPGIPSNVRRCAMAILSKRLARDMQHTEIRLAFFVPGYGKRDLGTKCVLYLMASFFGSFLERAKKNMLDQKTLISE